MQFEQLRKHFKKTPVITTVDIKNTFGNIDLSQLSRWEDKGLLYRLKKGHYSLSEYTYDPRIIANMLNTSYISMEYALFYHNMIPDIPYIITSITNTKSEEIQNYYGTFKYQKIKSKLFRDYLLLETAKNSKLFFKIATYEKALFDLAYLTENMQTNIDYEQMRITLPEDFEKDTLSKCIELVDSKIRKKRLENFFERILDA